MLCDAHLAFGALQSNALFLPTVAILGMMIAQVKEKLGLLGSCLFPSDLSCFSCLVKEMILSLQQVSDALDSQRCYLLVALISEVQLFF